MNKDILEKARKARGKNKIKKNSRASKSGERKPGEVHTMKAAIRTHCLMCCGGQVKEIRDCTARNCALFPYRLGTGLDHESIKEELEKK